MNEVETLTIDAAIDGEVERGVLDPVEIAQAIIDRYDERWLKEALFTEAYTILRERAQRRHGDNRRSAARGQSFTTRVEKYGADDFFGTPIYIPNLGWKTNGELTHGDCLAIAESYRKRASEMSVWADRYTLFAGLIKKQKVLILGEVAGIESLEAVAA